MKIDIDTLSEADLIDLNNRIIARLRHISESRAHQSMLAFRIGDRVAFRPDNRPEVVGTLTRYNRKSVTVVTDDGQRWNVVPGALHRFDPASADATVIPLRKV